MKNKLLTIFAIFIFSAPAHAQEKEAQKKSMEPAPLDYPVAYSYQPDYCDFIAGFPEKPILSNQCEEEGNPDTCYTLASYTKVFDMKTTVRVNIICNPASTEMYDYFKPETMEATVKKMTEKSVVKAFNVKTTQNENYRLTGLVGQGRKGLDDTLFIAQLWVSEKIHHVRRSRNLRPAITRSRQPVRRIAKPRRLCKRTRERSPRHRLKTSARAYTCHVATKAIAIALIRSTIEKNPFRRLALRC